MAVRNAERNGVSQRLPAFSTATPRMLAPLLGPVDLLLSNILRTVNVTLLPAIRDALAPGGMAIFSGMEEGEAPLFRPVLAAAGFRHRGRSARRGWWAVSARRTP